jgi:hypothetical protein
MRALLLLLLVLAVIVFVSFYGDALRPYWEGRLPRVASHLGRGDFREAASAMVDKHEDAPSSSVVVEVSTGEPAEPESSRTTEGTSATRPE